MSQITTVGKFAADLKKEQQKRLEKLCTEFLRDTGQLGFSPEQTLKHLTDKLKEGERQK